MIKFYISRHVDKMTGGVEKLQEKLGLPLVLDESKEDDEDDESADVDSDCD